jgi:flagellar biosynthesis protein FlhF
MHLKKYRRPTVKEALRAVREELGPQALVLSTETVPVAGLLGLIGRREIEVTAAVERLPVSDFRLSTEADDADLERRAGREIAARLQAIGMDPALARDVAGALPAGRRRGASTENIRRALKDQVTAVAATDESYAPIEVFVGPPGAGKTTTIAKIAAQERARHGQRLGLLAADGFRVGAIEQLRTFAEILGTPFTAARSPQELEQALAKVRCPILLDTAGRSPKDEASRDMFRVLASRRDVRTHLVMPAATSASIAARTIERFQDARPSRVVLTKLDESEGIGPVLSAIRASGIPLSYLGTGQSVPDDLQRATPTAIAGWVMGDDLRMGVVA